MITATWPQVRTDEPWSYTGPREDGLWVIRYLDIPVHYVVGEESSATQHVAYENWRYQHPKAEYVINA